ncbi:hypothetical protein T4B_4992 [Trichinella pseudospiralis]|uniref:Uncharacterized protein n=1 Tax=Trichinella pseudospiralis TaxID=6337 RepID=A0A0V1IJA8_TRIPS|nr:hypothetical protein T4B_4992 [Trichinella pseudospiralis]
MLLATAFLPVPQVDTGVSLLEAGTTESFNPLKLMALYYANNDRHNGALSSVIGHLFVDLRGKW